jgi:hypothetical protein
MADNLTEPHQVADQERCADAESGGEAPMTTKHINYCPVDERPDVRLGEQGGVRESLGEKPHRNVRPEVLKVFNARWKHNEPGCRLLADR